jgi:hypothetical protein
MTKTIDKALNRIRSWPTERQQDLVHMLDEIENAGVQIYEMSEAERQLVQVGLDQAERGDFVSDAEMDAFWQRNKRP